MNDHLEIVNEMRAVTISREYGSGGGEIAVHLAHRLGWQVIDHAIVERAAHALGTNQDEAEAYDEHAEGVIARLLNDLQYIDPISMAYVPPLGAVLSDEAYRDAVGRIVRAAAARGQVVIVGRGSQVLLAERRDVLRVRIIAPLEQRIAFVMQREGVDRQEAATLIHTKDRERTKYLETVYHREPDDVHLYDLVLNLSLIDPASAVNIICLALRHER
jgi:cytidylate kinase